MESNTAIQNSIITLHKSGKSNTEIVYLCVQDHLCLFGPKAKGKFFEA
jgi:hypothetical protein